MRKLICISALVFSTHAHAVDVRQGSYKLLRSASPVCKAVLNYLNHDFSRPFNGAAVGISELFLTDHSTKEIEIGGKNRQLSSMKDFDFDNDGIADKIFWEENVGSYIYGNTFYVSFGGTDKEEIISKVNSIPSLEASVFPCQFDPSVRSNNSCPPISQDADGAGIRVWISGMSVFFRGRYVFMNPIKFMDKTFVVLTGHSQDTMLYSAVIQPTGRTKFRSSCIFKGRPE